MNGIYNLYIPLCGFLLSIFCSIVFFSKKRVKNKETAIFSRVLVYSFVDSVLMVTILLLSILGNKNFALLEFLNKVDYAMYILFSSNFFLYVYYVLFKDNENSKARNYNFLFYFTTVIDVILMILLLFMKVDIHLDGYAMYSDGVALTSTMIGCGFYLVAILLCLLFNAKRAITRKLTPLYVLMFFFVLVFVLNQIDNTIVIVSFVFAFVNLIMLFTIENPDLKMIEKLNMLKSEAERANLAKSDFLASMSHEIRTPLNAITGFSYAIMAVDNLPEEAVDYAKDIVKSSDTLLEIVGGVLDVSKIESNKMEKIEVLYNPREEFESLAKLAKTRLSDKPIIFNYKIGEDVPYQLYGDKANIKKIVTNLLTNAVKYTQKGNILFSVKCINQNDISNIIISVQDTGLGIKTENISRLFNKFDRLDVAKNTTTEGTGLGLAITKKLVELMGGKINVQSQYGVGSIFVTQIPQRIAMMSKPLTDTQALSTIEIRKKNMDRETRINGKKILIVDDNALNIKVAKVALKNFDLVLDDVSSGEECINIIKSGRTYDLILMDIMMPNMGGEETFKKLKEIDGFNTPVIALTADAVSGSKDKYLKIGFTSYISKPFSPDEIKNELIKIFK